MARSIKISSGSILNGSPIIVTIAPNVVTSIPSFHRIVLVVRCGMTDSYEDITLSKPVLTESAASEIQIDISSVFRSFRDSYEYTPIPSQLPLVKFSLRAYDEYMLDGELHTNANTIYYPNNSSSYFTTFFGSFSDLDRLLSTTGYKSLSDFSTKPVNSPELVVVGDTYINAPIFDSSKSLLDSFDLAAPIPQEVTINEEGSYFIGTHPVYALSRERASSRQTFRFINSRGSLESISTPKSFSKKLSPAFTSYIITRQETFNTFSRSAIKKTNNRESWLFSTDPLTDDWLSWYLHEFLQSEHIWILIQDTWLPCSVTSEDEITFTDETNLAFRSLAFTVTLDINGSPFSH